MNETTGLRFALIRTSNPGEYTAYIVGGYSPHEIRRGVAMWTQVNTPAACAVAIRSYYPDAEIRVKQ